MNKNWVGILALIAISIFNFSGCKEEDKLSKLKIVPEKTFFGPHHLTLLKDNRVLITGFDHSYLAPQYRSFIFEPNTMEVQPVNIKVPSLYPIVIEKDKVILISEKQTAIYNPIANKITILQGQMFNVGKVEGTFLLKDNKILVLTRDKDNIHNKASLWIYNVEINKYEKLSISTALGNCIKVNILPDLKVIITTGDKRRNIDILSSKRKAFKIAASNNESIHTTNEANKNSFSYILDGKTVRRVSLNKEYACGYANALGSSEILFLALEGKAGIYDLKSTIFTEFKNSGFHLNEPSTIFVQGTWPLKQDNVLIISEMGNIIVFNKKSQKFISKYKNESKIGAFIKLKNDNFLIVDGSNLEDSKSDLLEINNPKKVRLLSLDKGIIRENNMNFKRRIPSLLLLKNGKVLIAGGYVVSDREEFNNSMEIYTP